MGVLIHDKCWYCGDEDRGLELSASTNYDEVICRNCSSVYSRSEKQVQKDDKMSSNKEEFLWRFAAAIFSLIGVLASLNISSSYKPLVIFIFSINVSALVWHLVACINLYLTDKPKKSKSYNVSKEVEKSLKQLRKETMEILLTWEVGDIVKTYVETTSGKNGFYTKGKITHFTDEILIIKTTDGKEHKIDMDTDAIDNVSATKRIKKKEMADAKRDAKMFMDTLNETKKDYKKLDSKI